MLIFLRIKSELLCDTCCLTIIKGLMITLFSYTFDINISYKAWLYKLYIISYTY